MDAHPYDRHILEAVVLSCCPSVVYVGYYDAAAEAYEVWRRRPCPLPAELLGTVSLALIREGRTREIRERLERMGATR